MEGTALLFLRNVIFHQPFRQLNYGAIQLTDVSFLNQHILTCIVELLADLLLSNMNTHFPFLYFIHLTLTDYPSF